MEGEHHLYINETISSLDLSFGTDLQYFCINANHLHGPMPSALSGCIKNLLRVHKEAKCLWSKMLLTVTIKEQNNLHYSKAATFLQNCPGAQNSAEHEIKSIK
jgi:hypothetical protein